MRSFTNDFPGQRNGLFIAFALGYIVIVEGFSFLADSSRTPLEGVHMSTSVLFDAPGPAHAWPGTGSTPSLLRWACWLCSPGPSGGLYDAKQFEADKWEVFVTPDYVRALLVDGLLNTLKMAFTAVAAAAVFGFIFGVGKMSEHAWVRWPSWAVVEFFRAVPVLLLMVFILVRARRSATHSSSYWGVVIALTLYNGSVLAEVLRAGVLAVPTGTGGGGVRDRHAQDPGDEHRADAAGSEDHAAGHHQPMRRGVEGHRPRAVHRSRRA